MAALSLGLVYVGTCNDSIAEAIMQALLEMPETALNDTMTRFACVGLGLLFLGRQGEADMTLEALKVLQNISSHVLGMRGGFEGENERHEITAFKCSSFFSPFPRRNERGEYYM